MDLSFYRTSDGKEIDFVLDNGKGLVLLEVKAAHSVTPADFRHISYFILLSRKTSSFRARMQSEGGIAAPLFPFVG